MLRFGLVGVVRTLGSVGHRFGQVPDASIRLLIVSADLLIWSPWKYRISYFQGTKTTE